MDTQQPSSNPSQVTIWLTILVVVVIAGLSAYLLWQSGKPLEEDSAVNINTVAEITNQQSEPLPLSVTLPEGWIQQQDYHEYNTVRGGGPEDALFIQHEAQAGQYGTTFLNIAWFHFNPDAPLVDIVPLLYENRTVPTPVETTIAGQPALKMSGTVEDEVDTEYFYLSENYIFRITDETLAVITIVYDSEGAYASYRTDIESMLSSLTLQPN